MEDKPVRRWGWSPRAKEERRLVDLAIEKATERLKELEAQAEGGA